MAERPATVDRHRVRDTKSQAIDLTSARSLLASFTLKLRKVAKLKIWQNLTLSRL